MEELSPTPTSIVHYKSVSLIKIETTLKLTERIINDRAEHYFNLGFVAINSSRLNTVVENFDKAIMNDIKYAQNKFYTFRVRNIPEDYLLAIELFSKAIQYRWDYKIAYYYRGLAKRCLEDYQNAIIDYSKAIEIDPNFAQAYYARSYSRECVMDECGAIEDLNKYEELTYGKTNKSHL